MEFDRKAPSQPRIAAGTESRLIFVFFHDALGVAGGLFGFPRRKSARFSISNYVGGLAGDSFVSSAYWSSR
ncbi:Hypothetical protein NTJ_05184 [Nesidiocoris tenuis]|uniref:Uncharacterized protein n=1 Tax=Nesidiocoris tenuis TaxID=355587 RepID=A0ABN7AJE3_9HEMI|nr:Hypothetical protein NTJ_05184 [Nesidiocoris tenuis]